MRQGPDVAYPGERNARCWLACLLPSLFGLVFFFPADLLAQTVDSLGLKLVRVPDALQAQVPLLPKNQGILVESVAPKSLAWRGGLRRFDVIVAIDAKPVADAEALEKLPPGQTAQLSIFRAGREMLLTFDPNRKENALQNEYLAPKGTLKPGGPPAVTIQLQPLDNGKLSLVLTFYADNGKMERFPYVGQLSDIERQIQKDNRDQRLPERVQDLVDVALKRVRVINQQQK
jgi:hypothetical protein